MVCTGSKSERQAHKAVLKVVDELKKGGIVIVGRPVIVVQNIVASAGLGGTIDLEKVVYSLKKTMYEPEQFPGLIYRMDEPDRKSTRLNSSHRCISYAVVCLQKKNS